MSSTWDDMWETVSKPGLESRPQQRALGWAVCESISTGKNLVGEAPTGTGKSYAYLLPAIYAVKEARAAKKTIRVVVSTETIALQDQLADTDLPELHRIHGGFRYRVLKGRTWYLCRNRAKSSSIGNKKLVSLVKEIDQIPAALLGDGERRDVERALHRELPNDDWNQLTGHTVYCGDARCKPEKCFAARARELAMQADIIVVNHAIMCVDADMKLMSDGDVSLLGQVDILVVDEAHTLERILVGNWTDTLSPWDRIEFQTSVIDGITTADTVLGTDSGGNLMKVTSSFAGLEKACAAVTDFFSRRDTSDHPHPWVGQNYPLSAVTLSGSPAPRTIMAMNTYENVVPGQLQGLHDDLQPALKRINEAIDQAEMTQQKGLRKLRKGRNAAEKLDKVCATLLTAMQSKDGIVTHGGVPYGVTVSGVHIFRDKKDTCTFRVVPLDVSKRCERLIWDGKISILLSATLTDPTDGSFRYTVASLGVKNYIQIETGSPFDFATQQLVYVTPGTHEKMHVHGAQSSVDELVDLIRMSNGRTLVLFTANAELEHAAEQIIRLKHAGEFPWPLYVQEKGVSKQKLADAFRSQEHSVLLGSKSFFTGVNFSGSTCSTVALAKFPLPMYNALCRQQITHWRSRGFPTWYERDALMIFAQAAGRLIRNQTDRGVIAILDQRCADPKDKIRRTANIGISSLGSPVTQSLDDVGRFLAASTM